MTNRFDTVNRMLEHVPLPRMYRARQKFDASELPDVAEAVRAKLSRSGMLARITFGDLVAIAVGSRGVADIVSIVAEVVSAVKAVGGNPFIIPAMGSHGGATAEGQESVLHLLGVTPERVGAPICATMETVELGRLPSGLGVYADKWACEADKIIVVNRIKPHTAFRGPVESGLTKMVTIGLGKQKGAESAHSYGFGVMSEHVIQMAAIMLGRLPVIFGVGTIENAYDRPASIHIIPGERFLEDEPALLLRAKALMPRICFDPIDVLVVEKIGKDISGDGMDPNITGRFPTPYADGGITAARVVVLGLTDATDGNANGIGSADITTREVFERIDWAKGYANALTSRGVNTVRMPMFMDTPALAVQAAIKTTHCRDLKQAKLVCIRDTLHLGEILISESMLADAEELDTVELIGECEAPWHC